MGFLNSLFSHEIPKAMTFQSPYQTFASGEMSDITWTNILTVNGLFWIGSSADRIVSEKIRAQVDGVIVLDYQDYTVTIPDTARVLIGSEYFSVIHVNNVGDQNQLITIPVKKIK